MFFKNRCFLCVWAIFVSLIFISQDVNAQPRGSQKKGAPAKEDYQPVNPSELPFSMKTKELWWEQGGRKASGTIAEFSFAGQKLALNSEKIDKDGFIDTRDYGKIKIQGGDLLTGGYYVLLTPIQKDKFLKLKKAKTPGP